MCENVFGRELVFGVCCWLVLGGRCLGVLVFCGGVFNNILIIFSTEVEMYHLTDLLQNNFYSAFYFTEKLLQRPFIPCRH